MKYKKVRAKKWFKDYVKNHDPYMTYEDIALEAEVSTMTVFLFVNQKRGSMATVEKIAKVFDLDPELMYEVYE